ncbi:SRPBCC domain-containing protein [Sphaerisporangium sp. NPDC051017]|uniref:SRPBCC family protein n=1 Tax=Sphaerisporangium sp. NPDC051017 TaxID=3154636 RepID=UPI00343BA33B
MKVVGSAVVGVDRGRVWAALQDPAVLVRTIPGCKRLEATGADTYRMTVTAGVASIKGVYEGEVVLSDPEEPEGFTLRARGAGAPGTVDATVRIRLSEVDGGSTRVDYDAEAVVGGMIGGVGQRMLGSVAKKTAGEFFTAVEHHLREPIPAAEPFPVAATPPQTPAALSQTAAAPSQTAAAPSQPSAALSQGPAAVAVAPATTPAVPGTSATATGPVAPAASPAVPVTTAAPATVGQVFERPPARRGTSGTPVWPVLTAFGMGAGIALGSAVIGWLLGRPTRR